MKKNWRYAKCYFKIVVFATKDAHRYKTTMLQKKRVTRGFAGTIFVLALQIKQHDLDFPTRENGKTNELYYFLFIRSGLYSSRNVTFIVSVIS